MRPKAALLIRASVVIGTSGLIAGCPMFRAPVPVELGSNLGSFEAQANAPIRKSGIVTGLEPSVEVGSGALAIDLDAITITPTGEPKTRGVILQDTTVLQVTVWIDDVEAVNTVCETGEEYGPFTVTLDENFVPVAIEPDEVNLTQTTVDLINGGEFSLCLEIVSPVDATITIASFTLNLGL